MTESVAFTVSLTGIWWRDPPLVNIYLNDEMIEANVSVDAKDDSGEPKVISFTRDLEEGEQTLKIEYLNKRDDDTKIDDRGNIIKDQVLIIKDVSIDEINLGNILRNTSVFYPRPDRVEALEWLEPAIKGMCSTGHNGIWEMKFSLPTYLWLLENL
jgi:hypothetical protein